MSGLAPLTVTFTNTTTGDVTGYKWVFGDGGTSALTHPTHIYTATGIYTVSLTAAGPGGSDTLTRTDFITVTEAAGPGELVTTTVAYAYAPLYRLTGADYTGAVTATYAYAYDAVGNRL